MGALGLAARGMSAVGDSGGGKGEDLFLVLIWAIVGLYAAGTDWSGRGCTVDGEA